MLVIGLMSGTSADGIDAALVDWPDDNNDSSFRLLAFREAPFTREMQQQIHALADNTVSAGRATLQQLAATDVALGKLFADAASRVAAQANVPLARVACIASHGQTVGHFPEFHATLQIGDSAVIAARTKCWVVSDFRQRDMAEGGEGAPLAPFFHRAAFASPSHPVLVVNLGGIANATWIAPGQSVVAFDTGPANVLVDAAALQLSDGQQRFDADGALAASGKVIPSLLRQWMQQYSDWLERDFPKSTGRELFTPDDAAAMLQQGRACGVADADTLRTLLQLSVAMLADHLPRLPGWNKDAVCDVVVGGGGVRNPVMLQALQDALPSLHRVVTMDQRGVPAQAAEAMAFALLGRNALLGRPNHLPECTGSSLAVLGKVTPGVSAPPVFWPVVSGDGVS